MLASGSQGPKLEIWRSLLGKERLGRACVSRPSLGIYIYVRVRRDSSDRGGEDSSSFLWDAVSLTPEGSWIMASPFVKLEDGQQDAFFGETLLRVLDTSRTGARKLLLDLARARNWTVFRKDTLACDVEKDESRFPFFPARNASRKPLASPAETCEALRTALSSCQPGRKKPVKPKPGR